MYPSPHIHCHVMASIRLRKAPMARESNARARLSVRTADPRRVGPCSYVPERSPPPPCLRYTSGLGAGCHEFSFPGACRAL